MVINISAVVAGSFRIYIHISENTSFILLVGRAVRTGGRRELDPI